MKFEINSKDGHTVNIRNIDRDNYMKIEMDSGSVSSCLSTWNWSPLWFFLHPYLVCCVGLLLFVYKEECVRTPPHSKLISLATLHMHLSYEQRLPDFFSFSSLFFLPFTSLYLKRSVSRHLFTWNWPHLWPLFAFVSHMNSEYQFFLLFLTYFFSCWTWVVCI